MNATARSICWIGYSVTLWQGVVETGSSKCSFFIQDTVVKRTHKE